MSEKKLEVEMSPDIPNQIFGKFLEELKLTNVPIEIIERLEDVILKGTTPNETDVKSALFFDV